jgi:muramidase (phage lysozyme)
MEFESGKINSAPLEEEVYVVANTYLLNGKEATITIKEKEALLVAADADLTVLEAKENGAEITTLKATVEDGIAKVKIKLRPKSDEDLKTWKEKLGNGKEDGTHKYEVERGFTVEGDLDAIAASIEKRSNKALTNHIVKKADISKELREGASYTTSKVFEFPKYKKEKPVENLWLKVECTGSKKYEGDYLKRDGEYFVVGKQCECEPRVRAFMRMLRVKEGTEGENGYTKQFSGKQFTDMSDHPREVIKSGGYSSSAAGAYQIMADTYDGLKTYRTKYNISNFDQESQDKLCLVIMKHNYTADRPSSFYNPIYWKDKAKTIRDTEEENKAKERRKRFKGQNGDIIKMLIDNNYDKAVLLSALCWASLPDAPYGQPTGTKEECKANYEKFLKEELAGKSDLYLKKGFLKEFGYDCCSDNGNGKWRMPIDEPMLCLYSQGGAEKPWHGSFGENIRDGSSNHAGVDLLAHPGTNVYACVKSKVERVYTSTSLAGNMVVLKVLDEETFKSLRNENYKAKYESKGEKIDVGFNYDGPFYLVYAHLSKNDYFKEGDTVEYDSIIGLTGISGNNGNNFTTRNPHLHFEVTNIGSAIGLNQKCNACVYFNFKTEDEMTEADKDYQLKTKEKEWS